MLFITIGENIPATAETVGNEEEKPNGIDVVDGGLDWLLYNTFEILCEKSIIKVWGFMKKRIKEFIEYYKELGFSKIFWYLLSIAYYIFDMWYMWNGESYIGFIKKYHNAFFEKPLVFLYPCVYPIVIAIVILLEFLVKKVNKLSIIFNYILITVLFAFDFFYELSLFA